MRFGSFKGAPHAQGFVSITDSFEAIHKQAAKSCDSFMYVVSALDIVGKQIYVVLTTEPSYHNANVQNSI
jgi:hypothetical protein